MYNKNATKNPQKFLFDYRRFAIKQLEQWETEGGKEFEIGFAYGCRRGHYDFWHYIDFVFTNKTPEECLKIFKKLDPSRYFDLVEFHDADSPEEKARRFQISIDDDEICRKAECVTLGHYAQTFRHAFI